MIRASEATLTPGDELALQLKYFVSDHSETQYESSNVSVLTVDADGLMKALETGETTITAKVTTTSKTSEDTMPVSVVNAIPYTDLASTRTATGIAFARKTDSIEVGEEFAVQAFVLSAITADHPYPYGYSDDNLVKWTSSNPTVCRVKNGVLLGVSEGTATITAQDIAETVSASFDVTVAAVTRLSYTDAEVLTVDESAYDWTTEESTTLAIKNILAEASAAGMKKVIFPNRLYQVSPVYGSIYVPTQMILDFDGGTIQIMPSEMTTSGGYQMFIFQNTEYSSIQNAIVYGERDLIEGTGVESCQAVYFTGYNYKSGLENCTISRSPGFNIGAINKRTAMVPFKYTAVEAGGIDANGQDVEENYAFRCNGYIDLSSVGSRFGFGNMQGYQGYLYLSARTYSIFFYDADHNFISSLPYCIQYYQYDKPENAKYCRIMFWQASAPTSGDGDYGGIAHVYSLAGQNKCYIRNCIMEYCFSTAIQPNGGENWVIENNTFRNNGYRDPASHIDWEDGRNNNKGHVLRNNTFENGGAVTVVGADGLVIHNNVFTDVPLNIGGEVQNSRIWLNQFIGSKAKCTIAPKTDEVFSQNYGYDGASYTISDVSGVGFAVREAENNFAS